MAVDYMDDHEFVRLVAERAQFTVRDTKILWDTIKEIIDENVDNKCEMRFQNFITIKFKSYMREKNWDQVHKKYRDPILISRISVKFSMLKSDYQKKKRGII
jgi:hypothetical protein